MDQTEMSEVLCLKWNNHKSIFLQNLSSLRTQELYSDATITCNGKYFAVHRLVLSTCSQYFEEIFERISMQSIHPFIIVTNIESGYLEALLNFMYNGEVNVLHEMLPGLIKAAEILKIKGLAVPDEETIEKELIYAREREVNNAKIEQISSHPKSPVHNAPQRVQPTNETEQKNCVFHEEPNAHISHALPPGSQTEFSLESSIYQAKSEVNEMCPIESPRELTSQERILRTENENEIKIEEGSYETQGENFPHVPLQSFPNVTNRPPQVVLPHENMNIQEVAFPYSNPDEQEYRTDIEPKDNMQLQNINEKCTTWEEPTNSTKEVQSNAATASVVQEVIHGIFMQSENDTCCSNQDVEVTAPPLPPPPPPPPPLATPPEALNVKQEEPVTPIKTRVKKRNSSSSSEHMSPTPKKCPKCAYVTKYVSTLRRHIMFKHTGEKPHKCHYCPYRSAHNFNMKKHLMIHTGEKPFSCPICPYKAAQNSNIKSHMKSHENKLLKAAIKGSKKEKI